MTMAIIAHCNEAPERKHGNSFGHPSLLDELGEKQDVYVSPSVYAFKAPLCAKKLTVADVVM